MNWSKDEKQKSVSEVMQNKMKFSEIKRENFFAKRDFSLDKRNCISNNNSENFFSAKKLKWNLQLYS